MNRNLMSVALCAASMALASAAFAADLTAAQIADKNAAARGGLAAWRAVESMSMTGEMDVGGKVDAKTPYTMSLKRPHMSRLEIRFQNQTAVQTYDGKQGWKYRPYLGRTEAESLTAAELKSEEATDELDGALMDAARKGTKVELLGVEKVEGKDAYKLRLTKAGGASRNVWVDAASFLEVKIDGEPRKLDGRPHKVAVFYRDYKTVGGLNIAHTLETVVDGVKQSRKIVVKSVTLNPKLDDSLVRQAAAAAAAAPPAARPRPCRHRAWPCRCAGISWAGSSARVSRPRSSHRPRPRSRPSKSSRRTPPRAAASRPGSICRRWPGRAMWRAARRLDASCPSCSSRSDRTRRASNCITDGKRSIRIYDGSGGWKLRSNPANGRPELSPYSDEELKYARGAQVIDGPLMDYVAKGGVVTLGGHGHGRGPQRFTSSTSSCPPAATTASGSTPRRFWKCDRTGRCAIGAGQIGTVTVLFGDYREFEGVKIPTTIETAAVSSALSPNKLVIERVALNPEFDDDMFARPDTPVSRRNSVVVDTRSAAAPGTPPPARRP